MVIKQTNRESHSRSGLLVTRLQDPSMSTFAELLSRQTKFNLIQIVGSQQYYFLQLLLGPSHHIGHQSNTNGNLEL